MNDLRVIISCFGFILPCVFYGALWAGERSDPQRRGAAVATLTTRNFTS
jgi:hypothetical protein